MKCTKLGLRWGSAPDHAGGAYRAPPDSLAVFKEPSSKGREVREGEGKGRKGEARKGDGAPLPPKIYP